MNIVFKNKGILSLLDMTTMGDSSKRNDDTKIGKFDSGLKYALSILYRNGINVEIYSGNSIYTFSSRIITDKVTNKTKELLVIKENNAEWINCKEHITAFSPQLGYEWKVWMAIRELYSNCLDEKGQVEFTEVIPNLDSTDTTFIIKSNSLLENIITNWSDYFIDLNTIPIYENNGIKIYKNNSEHLKLYKNNILIHEDIHTKSRFSYDYNLASIDEMRMLNNELDFRYAIERCICYCTDNNFIEEFLNSHDTGTFESKLNLNDYFSENWVKILNTKFNSNDIFIPYESLHSNAAKDNRINCLRRDLTVNSPTYYWQTTQVDIVKPISINTEEESFENIIKFLCKNFEIKYPIIESKISKFKCLPDISKKVLYVTQDFTSEDLWELVKAQFRIESEDDSDYCFKQYVKLINKL
jgi:hypothetical protein